MSGRNEIYVQPFPDLNGGRWQVSRDGGNAPIWGPAGDELFYRSSTSMMRVAEFRTFRRSRQGDRRRCSRRPTEALRWIGRVHGICRVTGSAF